MNKKVTLIYPLSIALLIIIWLYIWGPCVNPFSIKCFSYPGVGDYLQSYFGWIAYTRDLNLSIIPPKISNWTWPFKGEILFADSMPIFSIFFRPILNIINKDFQFFSLISLLNISLSFYCGISIGKYFNLSKISSSLLGFLLSFSPIAILRIIAGHESLSLHFLIIYPITLIITRKGGIWTWSFIFFIASGIHPYYLPLIFLFGVYKAISYYRSRSIKLVIANPKIYLNILILITLLLSGLYFFGGSSNTFSPSAEGLFWSANILALLNPQGTSSLLPDINNIIIYQWEGYSYLGLSGVFLITYASIIGIRKTDDYKIKIFPLPRLYLFMMLIYLLFSLGSPIYLGEFELLKTNFLIDALGPYKYIFRATGRFMWPIYYSIIIWSFIRIHLHIAHNKKIIRIILSIICILLLESNFFCFSLSNHEMKSRLENGNKYENEKSSLNLYKDIKDSNYFINATSEPYFTSKSLPVFMLQSINPNIKTNYFPRFARSHKQFEYKYSSDTCDIISFVTNNLPKADFSKTLFMAKDSVIKDCYKFNMIKIASLIEDDISIYKIKSIKYN